MKDYFEFKNNQKKGNDGSSLAIALFFFMLCALICAGILYVANSSIFGVTKHFNAEDVPTCTPPPITATADPTPTLDPAYEDESKAIKYVYDTLAYEFDGLFASVPGGGEYSILYTNNPMSLSYEIVSYVNAYLGVVYRGNQYRSLSELNAGDKYFVEVDSTGEMLPKEFIVTVGGYKVKVVFDLNGTAGSTYNKILKFNNVNFTVSTGEEGSGCQYVRTYDRTYEGGLFYLKWVAAGSGLPKRFVIKNKNW